MVIHFHLSPFLVMRLFKTVHDFDYSWHTVSAAQWQKYPNEHCPHVQHVDVLDSSVDPETGVLRIERLISVTQKAPGFILRVGFSYHFRDHAHIILYLY